MTTPQYQTKEDVPTPDGVLLKGAIIETDAPPGIHLIPLNDEARARMDDYFNEEFTYKMFDEKTGEQVTRKHRPRFDLRPPELGGVAVVNHPIKVIAEAPPPERGKTLAELINERPVPNRVAPGPDRATQVRQEFVTETALDDGSSVKVLQTAAKPVDPRAPNIQSSRKTP